MDYMIIAYALIAVVLIAYGLSIGQRMRKILRDLALFESKHE